MKGYWFVMRCLLLLCVSLLTACEAAELEDHPVIEPVLVNKSVPELHRCIQSNVERLPTEQEVDRRSYVSRYGRRVTFYVWVGGKLTEEVVLIRTSLNSAEIRAYALASRLVKAETYLQFAKTCATARRE